MKAKNSRCFLAIISALGAIALGLSTTPAFAASGDLDKSFGTSGGYTLADSGAGTDQSANVWSDLTLEDGSTISAYYNVLARRQPDGTPVTTYGTDGFVFLPPKGRRAAGANDLLLQGDSTILVAGGVDRNEGTIFIERRSNATGALDPGFGVEGLTTLTTGRYLSEFDGPMWLMGSGIDSSGRIYVLVKQSQALADGVLFRLGPDGMIDQSFGEDGLIEYDSGACGYPQHLTVRGDGIYVVNISCVKRLDLDGSPDPGFNQSPLAERQNLVETIDSPGPGLLVKGQDSPNPGLTVWKLNGDGTLDESFGTGGKLTTFDPGVQYWGLDLDDEGRYIATGHTNFHPGYLVVARFTSNGDRDLAFGDNGKVQVAEEPGHYNGTFFRAKDGPAGLLIYGDDEFAIGQRVFSMRLLDNDSFDSTWGEDGKYWFTTQRPRADVIHDTVATADGKTLATGESGRDAVVIRYLANGKIDQSFGEQGWVRLENPNPYEEYGKKIALMRNGDAVVCVQGTGIGSVVRIDSTGNLVPGFADGGRFQESDVFGTRSTFNRCGGISTLPRGRVLVGGTLITGAPVVFRLNANGIVDTTFGKQGLARIANERPNYQDPVAFAGLKDGRSLIASRSKLIRLKADGSRDSAFGRRGAVSLLSGKKPMIRTPRTIGISPKGAIFLGGTDTENLVLLKFDREGKLSRKFGKRGILKVRHPKFTTQINDIAFRPDGRVLLAVTGAEDCYNFRDCVETLLVYQLADRGKPDRTFGKNGLVTLRIGYNSRASSLELTKRGIVVGGFAETGTTSNDLLLLRLKK